MKFLIITVLLATYLWLFWCLSKGRISIRQPRSGGDTHVTASFDRKENPIGFWFSWIISLIGSTTVCIYMLFQT